MTDLQTQIIASRKEKEKIFFIVKFYNDNGSEYYTLYMEYEDDSYKKFSIKKFNKDNIYIYTFQEIENSGEKPIDSTLENFVGNRTGLLNKEYDEFDKHLNRNNEFSIFGDLADRAEQTSDLFFKNKNKKKKKSKSKSKKSQQNNKSKKSIKNKKQNVKNKKIKKSS
jgi:hypothetical protein